MTIANVPGIKAEGEFKDFDQLRDGWLDVGELETVIADDDRQLYGALIFNSAIASGSATAKQVVDTFLSLNSNAQQKLFCDSKLLAQSYRRIGGVFRKIDKLLPTLKKYAPKEYARLNQDLCPATSLKPDGRPDASALRCPRSHGKNDLNKDSWLHPRELENVVISGSRGLYGGALAFAGALLRGQSPQDIAKVFDRLDPMIQRQLYCFCETYRLHLLVRNACDVLSSHRPHDTKSLKVCPSYHLVPQFVQKISGMMGTSSPFSYGKLNAFAYDTREFLATKHGDVPSAVRSMIPDPSKYQILAVGEYHSYPSYRGTRNLDIFTKEILPLYAKHYSHIVLEDFPHDIPQKEFAYFKKHGRLDAIKTPELLTVINMSVKKQRMILLHACRANNIDIRGGGPSVQDFVEFKQRRRSRKALSKSVWLNSKRVVEELAAAGKKVMFYGGSSHNDLYGGREESSFGGEFLGRYSYAELDLVHPDVNYYLIQRGIRKYSGMFFSPSMDKLPISYSSMLFIRMYGPYLGRDGIVALTRASDSYAIVPPEGYRTLQD